MISYEDLEKARAERARKEAKKETKKTEKEARKIAKSAAEAVIPIVGKKERSSKRKAARSNSYAPETGLGAAGSSERQLARSEQELNMPDLKARATSLFEEHIERYALALEQYQALVVQM